MLCEDYFGILKFIRDRYHFIKRIINYKAGSVTVVADKLKVVDNEKLRTLFFIPNQDFIQVNFSRGNVATANSDISLFNSRLDILLSIHKEAISFYRSKVDAYNSYKHGLKLCLNGLGQGLSPEALNERKVSLSGNVFTLDNRKPNLPRLIISNIGNSAIRNNAVELLHDQNLLHLGLLHEVHIDQLVEISRKIATATTVLVANRTALIADAGKSTIKGHLEKYSFRKFGA